MGGGLLPIAVPQSCHEEADTPPSGASPLPHFFAFIQLNQRVVDDLRIKKSNSNVDSISLTRKVKCGRGLAPDSGASVDS